MGDRAPNVRPQPALAVRAPPAPNDRGYNRWTVDMKAVQWVSEYVHVTPIELAALFQDMPISDNVEATRPYGVFKTCIGIDPVLVSVRITPLPNQPNEEIPAAAHPVNDEIRPRLRISTSGYKLLVNRGAIVARQGVDHAYAEAVIGGPAPRQIPDLEALTAAYDRIFKGEDGLIVRTEQGVKMTRILAPFLEFQGFQEMYANYSYYPDNGG